MRPSVPADSPGFSLHPAAAPPAAPAPALAFSGVGMRFGNGTEALGAIDLAINRRELVAVVGPSGCGKSTLLRLAAGLDTPTNGTIAVDRDRLGYTFQDATLMPWRSVLGNVELLMELRGVPRRERRRRALAEIERVGLSGFETTYPRHLSGGMRMRVSLARSLALAPDVFLFDEPFGALDEITRERMQDELLDLFGAAGFAGLFITHSVSEAVYLAGRVIVMSPRPGRIVADIAVPFAYPRPPELRYDPDFARLAGTVSEALRGAIAADRVALEPLT